MNFEKTLSIVKPDVVSRNQVGEVIALLEKAGLKIVAAKMKHLSQKEAEGFYAVHKERPFYGELVQFMTTGPVLIMVLEGPNAIAKNREVMGATDPKKAAAGTIRAKFGTNVGENAVHGSDAPDTARTEIAFFFKDNELCSKPKMGCGCAH